MTSKTILVIDDDEGIREGLQALLSDEGFSITSAENGQAALDLLQTGPLPAVILLDLMMPVMDGVTFFEEMRGNPRTAAIPTIVLTAGTVSDRVLALPLIARLRKPIDIDQLLDVVRRNV